MTEQELEARRAYKRKWAKEHPESTRAAQRRFWAKKAAEAAAAQEAATPEPAGAAQQ